MDHQKYLELLPWYANGTLARAESDELRAHLGECLSCRSALNEELRLREIVLDSGNDPLGVRHGVSDLQRRIDRHEKRERRGARHRIPAFGFAVAAVSAIVAVFALLVVPDADFSTLSDAPESTANRIDIVFAAEPSAVAIEQFLAEVDGRIVGGPSEIGRYTVEIDSGVSLAELLETLRADSRILFAGRTFAANDPSGGEAQ